MRRVLHIGPSQTRGGMGAVIRLLAAHPPKGWQASTLASHADGGTVAVLKAWAKVRWNLAEALIGIDLVHIHTATRWSWKRKRGLIEIVKKAGIPIILSLHSGDFDAHCRSRGPEVNRVCADLTPVVLTEGWKQRLSAWIPHAKVIPNPSPDVAISNARDRRRFLLMGRPSPMKGQQIAIDAVRSLRAEGQDVMLDMTASTHCEDGITGHGWVEGYTRTDLLDICGTLLSPSEWEGLSMTVIEAMARGMPVIASPASEGVFSESGRIVERTPEAFADAMRDMLEGDTWGTMVAAGPTEAEPYRLENVIPMWGALYDEVVG
jgi:glycosyltransferase involved in cell wall biosynthesis